MSKIEDVSLKEGVNPLPVPDHLSGVAGAKLDAFLLLGNFLVARYTNTGSILWCDISHGSVHRVNQKTPIKCWSGSYPSVLTVHGSEMVQLLDLTNGQTQTFTAPGSLLDNVRRVVANEKYVVAISPKELAVWDREKGDTGKPRLVDMMSAPTQIPTASDRTTFINETQLCLANNSSGGHVFQVWDVATGVLVSYAENPSRTDGFYLSVSPSGVIAGISQNNICIWDTKACSTPLVSPCRSDKFESTVPIVAFADPAACLVGDNFGAVSLFTRNGRYINTLNKVRTETLDDAGSIQRTKVTNLLRNKVNRVIRAGRWVFAACENGRLVALDVFAANAAQPAAVFDHPTAGYAFRDVSTIADAVYALAVPQDATDGKTGTDLVIWHPALPLGGIRALCKGAGQWETDFPGILRCMCANGTSLAKNAEQYFPKGTYSIHDRSLTSAMLYFGALSDMVSRPGPEVPFVCFQNSARCFNNYMLAFSRIIKEKKPQQKVCPEIDSLRLEFMRSIDALFETYDFVVQAARVNETPLSYSDRSSIMELSGPPSTTSLSVGGRNRSLSFMGSASSRSRSGSSTRPTVQRSGSSLGNGPAVSPQSPEDEEELAIEELLDGSLDSLGEVYEQSTCLSDHFDATCTDTLRDQERASDMLSLYTKLLQLGEDLKEIGKTIADLRGFDESEWWTGGGQYDDEAYGN